jgi:hypothetical protein
MVFDLELKVEIVKEKKQPVFSNKKPVFSSKDKYGNSGWAVHMIFLGC